MKTLLMTSLMLLSVAADAGDLGYPLAPTGQIACYGSQGGETACAGTGQDASHAPESLRYRDNGNGTLTDLNTGLIWQQALGPKVSFEEAQRDTPRLAGTADWRLPTIKELYSLMDFSGSAPMPGRPGKPFINAAFEFRYGDPAAGERPIDAQFWSATAYTGVTMGRDASVFGVNFADGRIKSYPKIQPARGLHRMFVRYVRGNPAYGRNDFVDNRNGTVTDRATGLMWMQADSGALGAGPRRDGTLDWNQALAWAAGLSYAGHRDWRLPNAKELQSIVDYTRSPQKTGGPAISPLFTVTPIRDETGRPAFPSYWSGTTHLDGPRPGSAAVYLAFGEALGFMRFPSGGMALLDVHGAGAQRSDPKEGDPAAFPSGRGPQGDVIRINHMVRLVRGK